jgi:hypothetical protein
MAYRRSGTIRIIFFIWDWLWNVATRRQEWASNIFLWTPTRWSINSDKGIDITINDKKSTSWTIIANEQLAKLNLSSEDELRNVLIICNLINYISKSQVKDLLMNYKSACAWNWEKILKKFVNTELNSWLVFNLLDKHNIEWTQIMLWRLEKIYLPYRNNTMVKNQKNYDNNKKI